MFKTVIWATDGSETADASLAYARALVALGKGKLLVVHAEEHFYGGRASGATVLADEDELQAKIRVQVEGLRAEGIAATLEIIPEHSGKAAHAIAEVARGHDADVIVVGTRGHAPVAGLLVGSVTQRLLHTAPCPVLAVPASRARKEVEHEHEAVGAARS